MNFCGSLGREGRYGLPIEILLSSLVLFLFFYFLVFLRRFRYFSFLPSDINAGGRLLLGLEWASAKLSRYSELVFLSSQYPLNFAFSFRKQNIFSITSREFMDQGKWTKKPNNSLGPHKSLVFSCTQIFLKAAQDIE